jgi:hypothetical protein
MSAKFRVANFRIILLSAVAAFVSVPAMAQADAPWTRPFAPQYRTVSDARYFPPREVESLVAPIALLPDALLAQVLMATTYPYDIEDAAAWLDAPGNNTYADAALAAALYREEWDPSVKALAAAPAVLRVLDGNHAWSDLVGTAFAANRPLVMDAVQALRRKALTAGNLTSDQYRRVAERDGQIVIEAASPGEIRFTFYEPAVAFGRWTDADYAPYRFAVGRDQIAIHTYAPLWDWTIWDWRNRNLRFDAGRWSQLNRDRPPSIAGNIWHHEPGLSEVTATTRGQDIGGASNPPRITINVTLAAPTSVAEPPPDISEAPVEEHSYRDHDRWRERVRHPEPPKPDPRAEERAKAARAIQEMAEATKRQMEVAAKPQSDFMPQRPPAAPNHVPAPGELGPNAQRLADAVEASRRQAEAVAAAGRTPQQ